MHWFVSAAIALSLAMTLAPQVVEKPAVLQVFTTRAIATVLSAIGAEFEGTTGHTLDVTTDIAIRMVRRIQAGESFDVLVAAPEQIGRLIDEGQIIASTRRTLARSGIGIEVREALRILMSVQ